jgi:predicted DCC family thiol-disulfide oxidoreductase YuxK
MTPHVVFYDGVCGLCDRWVRFVLARDRRRRFRFAPLQGPLAARELPPRGGAPTDLDSVYVLAADGRLWRKSRAVWFVLREIGGFWRVVSLLRVVPPFITDRVYDLVARVRYRLFGRLEACRIPSSAERERFADVAT